jgi:hypothetical protein
MTRAFTAISEMDSNVKELVGFSLMGKVNGKIARYSMRLAGKQQRAGATIDAANDIMAEFDAAIANREFLSNSGVATEDDRELLEQWIDVKEWLVSVGFQPAPIVEMFRFMLNQTASQATAKHLVTDDQVQTMAKLSGMKPEAVRAAKAASVAREIARSKDTVMQALDLVEDVYAGRRPDGEPPEELPAELDEMLLAAIQSGKRSAVKIANSTEEALGSLALLRAAEDWT